ncbi:MAG: hypothetical protein ACHQ51_03615 [Elusimicrobiota bacterium]
MRGATARARGVGADAPPNYSKPGALIRTEGQLPVYSDPGNAGTHAVEGGGFIAQDSRRSQDSNRGPGVAWGAPDRAPTASGGSGGGSGIVQNAAPGGSGGSAGSTQHGDNGQGNNGQDNGRGNGNGVSGFDPSF